MSEINLEDDAELEQLMADLEAQTLEFTEKSEPKVEPEPEPEPEPEIEIEIEPEIEIEVPKVETPKVEIIEDEIPELEVESLADLEAEIGVNLAPTAVDELDAEQQVDVESVFDEPTTVEVEIDEPKVEVAPLEEPTTQAEELPTTTPTEFQTVAPTEALQPERHAREFKAEPKESEASISEKFAKDKFELKFRPNVEAFQSDTKLTDATLDKCMLDQASLMAIYTARSANAEAQASRAKLKFELLEAGLYDAWRKELAKHSEKVTEKAIENAVRTDKKWIAAKLNLIEANSYADIHKGFVSSLHDRRAMLIQRGSDRREEMKGQMRITGGLSPSDSDIQRSRSSRSDFSSNATEIARQALASTRSKL